MRYLLLIHNNEQQAATMNQEDMDKMMAAYGAFTKDIQEKGIFLAGDPLQPTATATTVRVRNGETLTTDGPFAETKEQLGGYYMVECKDLDEALEVASRIPGALTGSVEVRPVMEMCGG